MIKSMTGYGAAILSSDGKKYSIEIKSVNNRYSDFSFKVPRSYSFLEECLRKIASSRIKRGKVDIFVNIESESISDSVVRLNSELAAEYLRALEALSDKLSIPCGINAEAFLRVPDVFSVEKAEEDKEKIESAAIHALNIAIDAFDEMRLREGERLKDDLLAHLSEISGLVAEIEKRAPLIVEEYRMKITERIKNIMGEIPYDETRLLTEAAIFSDRVNVNEEIVRLKSHIFQFENLLEENSPVGRKIDFLIQEINREINTIGSKSNDLETARIVIEIKADAEKLREQIQNVE